ncbi:MAG TPA: SDR family NAD(P)-dependent oxidoreductase [Clostridia bacterium]|nr:SDR family NAD(P)-dependent oxidoreductase [Clostridia bacterium]
MSKVCFIIGASSGIGLATAARFLEDGYTVINGSRTECELSGVRNYSVDVATPKTIYAAAKDIAREFGRIDVFIYSAGYSMAAPVEFAKQEDYRYLFDVNFFGVIEGVRAVLPTMKKQGTGTIVVVSSIGGVLPIAFDSFYSSSKAAVNMLVRELNLELAPHKIRAISVMPGGTQTRFTFKRNVYSEEAAGLYADRMDNAVERIAKSEQEGLLPEKVAETIFFVATAKKSPELVAVGVKNKAYHMMDRIMPRIETRMLLRLKYKV